MKQSRAYGLVVTITTPSNSYCAGFYPLSWQLEWGRYSSPVRSWLMQVGPFVFYSHPIVPLS